MNDSADDTLSMSRLDVISCALGAAILLFLSLSAIRIQKPSDTSAERLLQVTVNLTEGTARTDSPVITFFVTPPDETDPIDVPAFAFDSVSGLPSPQAASLPDFLRLNTMGSFRISGSAIETDRSRLGTSDSAFLEITDPAPGEWLFQLAVTNSLDPFTTVDSGDDSALRVKGVISVISRTSTDVRTEEFEITAGRLSDAVGVIVD